MHCLELEIKTLKGLFFLSYKNFCKAWHGREDDEILYGFSDGRHIITIPPPPSSKKKKKKKRKFLVPH